MMKAWPALQGVQARRSSKGAFEGSGAWGGFLALASGSSRRGSSHRGSLKRRYRNRDRIRRAAAIF
jgi:hypothetical protein